MIRQLINDLDEQIEIVGRLQRAASRVKSIQAVANLLVPIQRDLSTWAGAFSLVEPYLDVSHVAAIRQQATTLKRQLSEARDRFASEYAATQLDRMQQAAGSLLNDTRIYWKSHAEAQVRPLRSQANLAHRLPKMHQNIGEINRTVEILTGLCDRLPQSAEELSQFNLLLAQLRAKLGAVDGLSSEQRTFLEKVQRGHATLADVSMTLLLWCREEDLAELIKIAF